MIIVHSRSNLDLTAFIRRIWPDLQDWGHGVGRERVARRVRFLRLVAQLQRRKRPVDQGQRLESAIAPNTQDRAFTATAPNRKRVADFTCVWTPEGWLYIAEPGARQST